MPGFFLAEWFTSAYYFSYPDAKSYKIIQPKDRQS